MIQEQNVKIASGFQFLHVRKISPSLWEKCFVEYRAFMGCSPKRQFTPQTVETTFNIGVWIGLQKILFQE